MSKSELDKFYTNPLIANQCYSIMAEMITNIDLIIEPSAGCGYMLDSIPDGIEKYGFDLLPERSDIHQLNFLIDELPINTSNSIFYGNPPFGKKSDLAIRFINKSFTYSSTVAFILPIQFEKYDTQKKILPFAKLIKNVKLPENAFLLNEKPYNVRCVFQIWTIDDDLDFMDLRIKNKPKTNHLDFKMYQYNCTVDSRKYFDYEWDFAVQRQGFGDYTTKIYNKKDIDIKKQWMFIMGNTEEAKEILLNIDYEKLSLKNTTVPGFGKADLIIEYERILNDRNQKKHY